LLAEVDPSIVLDGLNPRLIDEWQEVPSLWDAVRFEVDKTKHKGQFILTGSSTPKSFGVLHSGIGRIDAYDETNVIMNQVIQMVLYH
jgi:hypothetical protein